MGLNGVYNEVDEYMAGQVVFIAGNAIPTGYLECNGATVSRDTYATLFSAIGSIYGPGDGATTFNLPDLRGEFLRGADNGRGIDSGRAIGTPQYEGLNLNRVSNDFGYTNSGSYVGEPVGIKGGAPGVSIGNETRPRNIAMVACIKY